MDQLTELRQQMDNLKRRLDQSQIVNSPLMVEVMKQKSSWLNGLVKFELFLAPLTILFVFFACLHFGLNIWIAVTYLIGAVVDTLVDLKSTAISPRDISTLDTVSLRNKLIRQKQLRFRQYLISLPLALAWAAWFVFALVSVTIPQEVIGSDAWNIIALSTVAFVVIVAAIVCIVIYRKMQRTNQSMIDMLDSEA